MATRLTSEAGGPGRAAGMRNRGRQEKASGSQGLKELPSGRQAELAACLTQLGVPPARAKAWSAAAGGAADEAGAENQPASETMERLAAFLKTLEESPGQALKITLTRLPEVASLLKEVGIPAPQVERLLSSPGVQENGLTARDVRAAWIRSNLGPPPSAAAGNPVANLLTGHPAYQRLWGRLAVPAESAKDLGQALQDLGVSPDAVSSLEEQARQGPIPVGQVWKLLAQGQGEGAKPGAAAAAPGQPSPAAAPPAAVGDDHAWLKILVQAGMPPQVAQKLLGAENSGNAPGLRERLLALAPGPPPPEVGDGPKPLYTGLNLTWRSPASASGEDPAGRRFLAGQGQSGFQDATSGGKTAPAGTGGPVADGLDPKTGLLLGLAQAGLYGGESPPAAGPGASTSAPPYLPPEVKEGLWAQIQAGVTDNLRPGENRLSLQLSPPELGQVHLTLNLKGEFLQVVAVTARPEVAQIAVGQVQQLVQALSQQGLILSQFQVQVQDMPGRQTVMTASGQRDAGRREAESGMGGKPLPRRRLGQLDFFV